MRIDRLARALGARVTDLDLRAPLDDATRPRRHHFDGAPHVAAGVRRAHADLSIFAGYGTPATAS